MQLISTLSHMPFKVGDDLYYCTSAGLATADVPQLGVPLKRQKDVKVNFQPWTLVKQHLPTGVVTPVPIPFPLDQPRKVICNPVVSENGISFVYNSSLWWMATGEAPIAVADNIFTGYQQGEVLVTATGKGGTFFISGEEHHVPFDNILRIIPNGENYLLTGRTGDRFHSLVYFPGLGTSDILVNGKDVYKCCLDGDQVIHAVRLAEFEQRYLHIDTFELCDM
jgi:hypothetical protein